MNIGKLRKELDKVDDSIISVLAKRMSLVRQIAQIKSENNLEIKDKQREKKILSRIKKRAIEHNLDPEIADKIMRAIIDQSVRKQKKQLEKNK